MVDRIKSENRYYSDYFGDDNSILGALKKAFGVRSKGDMSFDADLNLKHSGTEKNKADAYNSEHPVVQTSSDFMKNGIHLTMSVSVIRILMEVIVL